MNCRPTSSPDLLPLPVLTSDPALLAVMEHCEELAKLIPELKERDGSAHPRECVPATVQELIIGWLGGINPVSNCQSLVGCCAVSDEQLFTG